MTYLRSYPWLTEYQEYREGISRWDSLFYIVRC